MATSSPFIIIFLIAVTISLPLIHARNSQFFSKVSPKPTETPTADIPNKEQEEQSLVKETGSVKQPEFVPQNEEVYGHETGLNPPEAEEYYNNDKNGAFKAEKFGNGNGENETFYSNNVEEKLDTSADSMKDDLLNFDDVFDKSKYGKEETFYTNNNDQNRVGTDHYATEYQNDDNSGVVDETETYYNTDRSGEFGSQLGERDTNSKTTYYNDNRFDDNRFTNELNSRYKAYRGEPNAVRKGMSDTRLLENGKYFYDVDNDSNLNAYRTQYDDVGSRAYESNEIVGKSKYDDTLYENTTEEVEESRLNNQYDP